jgi:hypothetical protein
MLCCSGFISWVTTCATRTSECHTAQWQAGSSSAQRSTRSTIATRRGTLTGTSGLSLQRGTGFSGHFTFHVSGKTSSVRLGPITGTVEIAALIAEIKQARERRRLPKGVTIRASIEEGRR